MVRIRKKPQNSPPPDENPPHGVLSQRVVYQNVNERRRSLHMANPNVNEEHQTHQELTEDGDNSHGKGVKRAGKRGRPVGWEKGENSTKDRRSRIIKTGCTVKTAMAFLRHYVFPALKPEHSNLLAESPFFHLFRLPDDAEICCPMLHNILLRWDIKDGCLKHKGKSITLSEEDVCLVMGFGLLGDKVDLRKPKQSELRNRYFSPSGEITRTDLEIIIGKLLHRTEPPVPAKDIAGLVIMYLFTTVLFPQACGSVPGNLFHYLDDISTLGKYSWGKAVHDLLWYHIPKCAEWCQSQDRAVGNSEAPESQDRAVGKQKGGTKARKPRTSLPGCTLALLTWFFEYFKIDKFRKANCHIPRFHNWHFKDSSQRDVFSSIIDDVPPSQVLDKLEPSLAELEFAERGFEASEYIQVISTDKGMRSYKNKNLTSLLMEMAPVYLTFGFSVCDYVSRRARIDEKRESTPTSTSNENPPHGVLSQRVIYQKKSKMKLNEGKNVKEKLERERAASEREEDAAARASESTYSLHQSPVQTMSSPQQDASSSHDSDPSIREVLDAVKDLRREILEAVEGLRQHIFEFENAIWEKVQGVISPEE